MLTVNDTSLYTIHFTIFLFTWRADKETYKYFDITESKAFSYSQELKTEQIQ